MSDRDVRRRLLLIHPPDEMGAERRAWAVVRTALEEREPVKRSRNLSRPALAIAIALALVGAVANPPVLSAIRDALGKEHQKTVYREALFSLPTGGRLLVNSGRGPWVVKPGGGRRLLGSYRDASWSPHGLFLTALGPHEVVARHRAEGVDAGRPERVGGVGVRLVDQTADADSDHAPTLPLAPCCQASQPAAVASFWGSL